MGWFILGLCIGGTAGVLAMCMLIMGSDKNEEVRDANYERKNVE